MDINEKFIYVAAAVIAVAFVAVLAGFQGGLGYDPRPPSGVAGAYMSVKPVLHTMGPGEMIAVVITVENLDGRERNLYYSFGFEASGSDSGTKREEFAGWASMNDDATQVPYGGVAHKDAVISVPLDAALGEYVFNVYSCYSESPDGPGGCGRASPNIWGASRITIRVVQ